MTVTVTPTIPGWNVHRNAWIFYGVFCSCVLMLVLANKLNVSTHVGPVESTSEYDLGIEAPKLVQFRDMPSVIQYKIRRPDGKVITVFVASNGTSLCVLHEYASGSLESK